MYDAVVTDIADKESILEADVTWEMVAPRMVKAATDYFRKNKHNLPVWVPTTGSNNQTVYERTNVDLDEISKLEFKKLMRQVGMRRTDPVPEKAVYILSWLLMV